MSDDEDNKPIMPLEPPANVPELRAEYDEALFQYHQKLRAWREGKREEQPARDKLAPVVHLAKFKEGRADLNITVRLKVISDTVAHMAFLLCETVSGRLAIALCAEIIDANTGEVELHTPEGEYDDDPIDHYIGRIVVIEEISRGLPTA